MTYNRHYDRALLAGINPFYTEHGPRWKTERDRCTNHAEDFVAHPEQLILSVQPYGRDRKPELERAR